MTMTAIPSFVPEEKESPLRRRLCMTMTTTLSLSQKRRRALQKKAPYDHGPTPFLSQKKRIILEKKALYDHDYHSFPFQKEEESFSEEGSV